MLWHSVPCGYEEERWDKISVECRTDVESNFTEEKSIFGKTVKYLAYLNDMMKIPKRCYQNFTL